MNFSFNSQENCTILEKSEIKKKKYKKYGIWEIIWEKMTYHKEKKIIVIFTFSPSSFYQPQFFFNLLIYNWKKKEDNEKNTVPAQKKYII